MNPYESLKPTQQTELLEQMTVDIDAGGGGGVTAHNLMMMGVGS